jgi:hypothetical protein
VRVLWRLSCPSSGFLNECQIIDRPPLFPEVRVIQVQQGATISSSSFTDMFVAEKAAAALGAALRADGWIPAP